jgi:hypothetical protein
MNEIKIYIISMIELYYFLNQEANLSKAGEECKKRKKIIIIVYWIFL